MSRFARRPSGVPDREQARHPAGFRRGGVMVMVLACMAVATAIGMAMLRSATAGQRGLRTERHLRQVERLLVAAADLAAMRQAEGERVEGEILLESADLAGAGSARITLAADPADPRRVQVIVEHPLEGPVTVRRTRSFVLALPLSSTVSPEESLP